MRVVERYGDRHDSPYLSEYKFGIHPGVIQHGPHLRIDVGGQKLRRHTVVSHESVETRLDCALEVLVSTERLSNVALDEIVQLDE